MTALADAGLLFRDPLCHRSGDADLIGKAAVGGRRWKLRGDWRTDRTGTRYLNLRFNPLQTPPPRDPAS